MAELSTDPAERAELADVRGDRRRARPAWRLVGQVAELAHTVLPRDYRSIDTREARIILLEGAPAVLPPFDKKLQAYTHRRLEKMGVEIHLNTLAVGMDDDSVTVKGPDGDGDDPHAAPGSGRRASRPRRWRRCSPSRRASRPTARAGSR